MRDRERQIHFYMKCLSTGAIATAVVAVFLVVFIFLFGGGRPVLAELMFYESIPFYKPSGELAALISLGGDDNSNVYAFAESDEAAPEEQAGPVSAEIGPSREISLNFFGTDEKTGSSGGSQAIEPIFRDFDPDKIVGVTSGVYHEQEYEDTAYFPDAEKIDLTKADIDKLRDIDYLRKNFYTVHELTEISEEDFDAEKFLAADLSIKKEGNLPKVLIVHTHAGECFSDSDPENPYEGVVGAGEKLAEHLLNKYGIVSIHNTTRYDTVDGRPETHGAYERIEPDIKKILEEYPSIEIVIDLHRDGVIDENLRFVTEIDGRPMAQLMFFNGLSKILENGVLKPIQSLPNPNLATNLAFSFNLQLAANELYPGLTRKIYLRAYRYTLHLCPKSILVELGSQTNTMEEAFNSMEPLADIIASVVLE